MSKQGYKSKRVNAKRKIPRKRQSGKKGKKRQEIRKARNKEKTGSKKMFALFAWTGIEGLLL